MDGGREPPPVRFERVGFRYGGTGDQVLDEITLSVEAGSFVGLIGPTGAGKSTFCQMLNGIVPQFHGGALRGHAWIGASDNAEVPVSVLAREVGMVLEDPETQIVATSVETEIAFALENQCVPTGDIRSRLREALSLVGLDGLERKHPANLSGGQKQRLAIAAALALHPRLMVLDEPTSQLDPQAARDVFSILRRINRERGMTVIVASHAAEELAAFATRIVLLEGGRVAADGPPGTVFADVDTLARARVRPPEVTRAVAALAAADEGAGAALPVTLEGGRDWIAARAATLRALPLPGRSTPREPSVAAREAPALEVHGLHHVYPDGTEALRGVELSVGRGECIGLVGHNGSGKSTLVKHFLKLLSPSAGRVVAEGRDLAELGVADLARRIGYVAQNAHQQLFCASVREEVAFALRFRPDVPAAEIEPRVDRALAEMGLTAQADRHPVALARGDQLRTVIAAILALEPAILIFDEPTTGQDWQGALAILDVLRRLNAGGRTVVLITHHLYLLRGYVDRLVVLADGRVCRDGTLEDVLYDEAVMDAAGLTPPQTVTLSRGAPWLDALRPVAAEDIGDALARAATEGAVA